MRLVKFIYEGKVEAVATKPITLIRFAKLKGMRGTWQYFNCPRHILNIIIEKKLMLYDY